MAKLLKLRRGTTSQHSSFTGAEGEVTVDTDKETLVVHNGAQAGGYPLARESDLTGKAGLTGATFTGNVVLDNDKEVRFSEADSNGAAYIGLKAPTDLGSVSSYTLTLPTTAAATNKVLKTDSSTATQLVWADDTNLTLLDEDNFATDSATAAASQQSIKAYGAATYQPLDADLTSLAGCQSGAAGAIAALLQAEVEILDGATVTTAELNTLDGYTGDTDDLIYAKDLRATGVTATEFDYLDDVTSNIQTQLNAKGAGDAVLATDFQQWAGTQRAAVKAYGSVGDFNIELDQGNLFTITLTGGSTLTFKKDSSTALNADCIGISGTIFLTNPANAQAMAGHCKKASGVEIPATAGDYIIPFTVIAADKVLVDVIGPVS